MGLFNSGKNEKVEKVNKYERHYNVPSNPSRRRSLKYSSKEKEKEKEKEKQDAKHHHHGNARALSQPPPFIRYQQGQGLGPATAQFFPPSSMFSPNAFSTYRYPMGGGIPMDLAKYSNGQSSIPFSSNPYAMGSPLNYASPSSAWNNIPLSVAPPTNYPYMVGGMQF